MPVELAIVVLMALGDVQDLPSTGKNWWRLLVTVAVLFALVFAFLYFWPGPRNTGIAGR